MAKIEDLIAQIPDERLRKGIAAEVKALKKTKKFGLVFEEHLPETVRLPKLPVKPGELVALKRESGNQLWRVKSIEKSVLECGDTSPLSPARHVAPEQKRGQVRALQNIAVCERALEGYPASSEANKEFPVSDLVVVRSFGDAIYPALVPVDRVERGGPDKPWHVLINADNFHALQLLLYCYEGKVDVIYIDPPYNDSYMDALPKAIGLAKFAEEHGKEFGRLIFARKKGGKWEFADMCEKPTRETTLKMKPGSDIGSLFL